MSSEAVPGTSVVATLLVHGRPALLPRVVESVLKQTNAPLALLVLDNGGPGDPIELPLGAQAAGTPAVTVLNSTTNIGVGGGHNLLVREAVARYSPEWVWMLEHDTLPDADCLDDLLRIAQRSSDRLGAVVPVLAHDESERSLTGQWLRAWDLENARLTFNAVLLSTEALGDVGPLREDLFVGGEDWDLTRRLKKRAWRVVWTDRVSGLHASNGAGRHGAVASPMRQYYATRSGLLCADSRREAAWLAARLAFGGIRDMRRSTPLRRVKARLAGIADGLRGIGGPAEGRW